MYRSSTGDLSYHDDPPVRGGGGGGERWNRDRFERMRGSGGGGGGGGGGGSIAASRRGPPSRDADEHYRFQEHDRFPGGHRNLDMHDDYHRRGPRVLERERVHEDDLFDRPSRRRNDLFDEPTPSQVANQALAPYRRPSVVEKNVDLAVRRPQRPGFLRRQSSLDTFDRRPLPRYDEMERVDRMRRERDEWRPPANVEIPLPFRRRRSPPRHFDEEEFEEIRFRESERDARQSRREEFREVELMREKSKVRRSRSRAARSIAQSVRSSSSSSFEEVEPVEPVEPVQSVVGRRGKTRLPKRLCKKQAVIELGYPYEEEDDFIIVKRALEKDHIDELIKISENYREEKSLYVYEEKEEVVEVAPPPPPASVVAPPASVVAPPAPPPPESIAAPPPPASVVHSVHSVHSHHATAPPPPHSVHSHHTTAPPPPPTVHYPQSVRSVSPSRHGHEVYEERIEESNHIGGPLTVLVPEERRMVRQELRSERDIKEEIRMLESERRMLKYEREGDYEIVERREPRREVIRVDKDRKVRKGPTPKLVAAMMATLT